MAGVVMVPDSGAGLPESLRLSVTTRDQRACGSAKEADNLRSDSSRPRSTEDLAQLGPSYQYRAGRSHVQASCLAKSEPLLSLMKSSERAKRGERNWTVGPPRFRRAD